MTDIATIGIKVDTDGVERGITSLEKLVGVGPKVERSMGQVGAASGKAGQGLRNLGTSEAARGLEKTASAGAAAAASLGSLRNAVAGLGAVALARSFIGTADAVTSLHNQLRLATGSTATAASAYSSLFHIAQRSRVGFLELGNTFASIARAAEPLGISQDRLLNVTESIGNAMTISGGSAQGLQAALVQLGQGLASGTLRGEELNSVMEQAPRLAKALADGLGVTTGKLREMGANGAITSEAIIKALESQASVLQNEVSSATLTVGQAMTQLGNSTTGAIGELDKVTGASAAAASAVSTIASAIDSMGKAAADNEAVIKAVLGFSGVIVGAKAASVAIGGVAAAMTAARVATLGFTAALAANPIGAALVTITAIGAAAYASGVELGAFGGAVDDLGNATERAAKEQEAYNQRLAEAKSQAASAAVELERAEEALQALADRGGKSSPNLMLREAYNDAQRLVDKLREAKRERDLLLMIEGSRDARDKEAGNSRGSRANFLREQEAASKKLLAISDRENGITKQFKDDLAAYQEGLRTGVITLAEYTAAVTKLNAEREKALQKRAGSGGGSKGAKDAERLDASLHRSAVSQIQSSLQDLSSSYSVAESIMEARRSAGLLSEQDYYTAKRSFIELNKQAQLSALAEENAALAKQQLKGAEAVARDQKIAENKAKLAQLSLEASGKLEVLDIQQAASARQHQEALLSAKQAADEYIASIERASAASVAGIGMGERWRSEEAGRLGVRDKFADQRRTLANQLSQAQLAGPVSSEFYQRYLEQLEQVKQAEGEALEKYENGVAARIAAEGKWQHGATEALRNYQTSAANVAEQTASMFTKAFQGMEDALVSFITTGKLDFNSLANSIVADITRIIVKQQLSNALGLAGGAGSGGGLMSLIGAGIGLFGGTSAVASTASALPGDALDNFIKLKGLSSGGYTGHGGKYEPKGVVHGGEFVINAASTKKLGLAYLNSLNGYANGGYVGSTTPTAANPQQGGGQAQPQVLHVTVQMPAQGATRETALQFGRTAGRQMQVALRRND